jgi:2,3-bisphosphoglycerate-independent phosphoglycerate mutase
LHIFGLLSDGGIHSNYNHLFALIDMCKRNNINNVYYHIFTDGRDTSPNSGKKYIELLEGKIRETGVGSIASISGRYYAMDRDNNYDRLSKAYDAIVYGKAEVYDDAISAWKSNQDNGITDEFIVPSVINKNGIVCDNDGLICFNYRPDRLRELFSAITNPNFNGFETKKFNNIKLVTMMPVSDEVICKNAYFLEDLVNTCGEYVASLGYSQLRIAETEKYAHVTYFFDGGVEKDLERCKRVLIPSPKVSTYDLKPEMSAYEITDTLIDEFSNHYDMIILNFANGDMVGHTGNYDAAVKAVEVIDECLGKIISNIDFNEYTVIVTADHGNCEIMINDDGSINTQHTTSMVPVIITNNSYKVNSGKLGDLAPTILEIMGIDVPSEMTGNSLIERV